MKTSQLFSVLIAVSVIPIAFIFSLYVPLDPDYIRRKGDLIGVPKFREAERNSHPEFEFITFSSRVAQAYGAFPDKTSFKWNVTGSAGFLFWDGCDVQLEVELIDFMQAPNDNSAALCLFKEDPTVAKDLCTGNSEINILGRMFDPKAFYQNLQPVTGFVMGEYSSLVSGYIVNEFFYGTIRMYDPVPGHNIVFYVEPIENLGLYNGHLVNVAKPPGKNAILYEYLRHEDGSFAGSKPQSPPAPNPSSNFEQKAIENVNADEGDIFEHTIIKNGTSTNNFFDVRRNSTLVCEACVWVQPNLAKKYGLGNGVDLGVGEIISILQFVQHVYQGLDFNRDGLADELQFLVSSFIVSDDIQIYEDPNYKPPAGTSSGSGLPTAPGSGTTRKRRSPLNRTKRVPQNEVPPNPNPVPPNPNSVPPNPNPVPPNPNPVPPNPNPVPPNPNPVPPNPNPNPVPPNPNPVPPNPNPNPVPPNPNPNPVPPNPNPVPPNPNTNPVPPNPNPLPPNPNPVPPNPNPVPPNPNPVPPNPNPVPPNPNPVPPNPNPGGDNSGAGFKEDILNLTPKGAYSSVKKALAKLFAKQKCCVILAYIYHNMAPKIAVSSLGGACSKRHAVGLISGYLHDHKIAKYDMYRATMHALGHLFGANKDSNSDPRCKVDLVDTPSVFNELLMDNFHKTDIGIRPNSMRYSPCAKNGIATFLTSANANCFKVIPKTESAYCGNGIIEKGEECDCGLLWQCHISEVRKPACCGESDTFLGCKRLGNARFQQSVNCHRPWDW